MTSASADAYAARPRIGQIRRCVRSGVSHNPQLAILLPASPYVSLSDYLRDGSPSRLRSLMRAIELATKRLLGSRSSRWAATAARQVSDAIANIRTWCADHSTALKVLIKISLEAARFVILALDGADVSPHERLAPLPAR